MSTDLRFIQITTANKDEAEEIGQHLVEERLAACANIHEEVSSIYWWHDQIQKEKEAMLSLKTHESKVSELIKRVKEIHSYSCPCIISTPITEVNPEYADWVKSETLEKQIQNIIEE
jgi:periplasmic divalent cation tolerance protein